MKITFHGGKCCGVKTISGFPKSPLSVCGKVDARPEPVSNLDAVGFNVTSEFDVFNAAAPEETAIDRLDRLIAFIKKWRPCGIIEVCLAEGKSIYQVSTWEESLLERGFKLSIKNYNSNSGNIVHVYHLGYGSAA